MSAFSVNVDLRSRRRVRVLRGGTDGGRISFPITPIVGSISRSDLAPTAPGEAAPGRADLTAVPPAPAAAVLPFQLLNVTSERFRAGSGVAASTRYAVGVSPSPKSVGSASPAFRLVVMPCT